MSKLLLALLCVAGLGARADISTASPEIEVPKVFLDYWNKYSVVYNNNCYNYATNRVTNSFAQPGQASGSMYTDMTCDNVYKAASADWGLTPTAYFPFSNKKDETLIALVIAPDYDFHWYRRDNLGQWSHKPGSTPATIYDNSHAVITDPEHADRGYYSQFCGYFRVKNYPTDADQQNAGYVRIGNMTDLPVLVSSPVSTPSPVQTDVTATVAAGESYVEILKYSGRENPKIPFSDFFTRPSSEDLLSRLVPQVRMALHSPLKRQQAKMAESHLGDQGILIHDTQGLLFPQGTQVHVQAQDVLVQAPDQELFSISVQ
jgi:hypothetical protein